MPASEDTLSNPNAADPNAIKQEDARVIVLNGTARPGYAERAAALLRARGLNVVQVGNAERADYAQSRIENFTDKSASLAAVLSALKLVASQIQTITDASVAADIRIILGADWNPPAQ